MNSWMRTQIKATALPLALVMAVTACNASGGGAMGGKITTRTKGGELPAEKNDDVIVKDPPTSGKPIADGSEYDGEIPVIPGELEKPKDPVVDNGDDDGEVITIPGEITGAFLFCFRDKIEASKATVYCATEDTTTKKPFEPAERFASYAFSTMAPDGLTVTKKDLPLVHRYNVEFTIAASSKEALLATQSGVKFLFDAVDFDDKPVSLNTRVTTAVRPDIWVQSQKPQNNQGFRCLDRYRMRDAQPLQVVTTPCGSNSITHDWYVTADSKIAHVGGECLAFDAFDGLTVVRPCDSAQSPKFEFNGEQIKLQNSGNCLGLKNPDASGVDYSASVPCNVNDVQQRWKISPQAAP